VAIEVSRACAEIVCQDGDDEGNTDKPEDNLLDRRVISWLGSASITNLRMGTKAEQDPEDGGHAKVKKPANEQIADAMATRFFFG
jgi:hypothetical protein